MRTKEIGSSSISPLRLAYISLIRFEYLTTTSLINRPHNFHSLSFPFSRNFLLFFVLFFKDIDMRRCSSLLSCYSGTLLSLVSYLHRSLALPNMFLTVENIRYQEITCLIILFFKTV